jgi:hypothetical protein
LARRIVLGVEAWVVDRHVHSGDEAAIHERSREADETWFTVGGVLATLPLAPEIDIRPLSDTRSLTLCSEPREMAPPTGQKDRV